MIFGVINWTRPQDRAEAWKRLRASVLDDDAVTAKALGVDQDQVREFDQGHRAPSIDQIHDAVRLAAASVVDNFRRMEAARGVLAQADHLFSMVAAEK